jgi:uncharacterized paraquat-inducible protein A
MPDRDWHDDEEDWSETGGDYSDSDDAETAPCPACGADIYDDLDHCPRCGHWLTDADRGHGQFPSRPVRIVAIVLIAILVILLLAETVGFF